MLYIVGIKQAFFCKVVRLEELIFPLLLIIGTESLVRCFMHELRWDIASQEVCSAQESWAGNLDLLVHLA